MPRNRIALIVYKEWLELRQLRTMLFSMAALPLFFTLLPIGLAYFMAHGPADLLKSMSNEEIPNIPTFKGLTEIEAAQAIIGEQFSVLLLLTPVLITSIIASYSIVGEKTGRTLEPVLATPVRTWELLLAKSLSALVPGMVITWLSGGVFVVGMWLALVSQRVFELIISPSWLLIFLICAPLLGLISTAATVAVSSRANDPRTAQQFSVVVIIPLILLSLGQITGLLVLQPAYVIAAAIIMAGVAALTVWIAVRLFQREVILTKWT